MTKKLSIVALLCFCLITLLSHDASSDDQTVQITEISGLVQIQKSGTTDWQKVEAESKLSSGDKVRSFLESSAKLSFTDQSVFILGENSFLEIKDVSTHPLTNVSKRELKLNLGTLRYSVTPKAQTAAEYKIHSSTSIVGITGTEGVFFAKGDGKVTENILIEGSTYNTSAAGQKGVFQTAGHTYKFKSDADLYKTAVTKEAERRVEVSTEYWTTLQNLMAQIQTKQNEGMDIREVKEELKGAFLLLEKRSYDLLDDKIVSINEKINKLKKSKANQELLTKLQDLAGSANELDQAGHDMTEAFVAIANLEKRIRQGNTAAVNESFLAIEQMVAASKEQQAGVSDAGFSDRLRIIQQKVQNKEKQGFEVVEIKAMLRQSQTSYREGNAVDAYALAYSAESKLDDTIKGLSENIDQSISQLVKDIELKKAEGYDVLPLEVALGEIQKSIEAELFLKVQTQLTQLQFDLESLNKRLPLELKAKVDALKKEISYYRSLGYDLIAADDAISAFNTAIQNREVAKVRQHFDAITKMLKELPLPSGFVADWEQFQANFDQKSKSGLDLKQVKPIKEQVQSAIDAGDVKLARKLLQSAKEQMKQIADTQPPKVQVIELLDDGTNITLKGFAQDNTADVDVFVNGTLVEVAEDGNFAFETLASAYLNQLSVTAKDANKNWAPAVVVPLKTSSNNVIAKTEDLEAKIEYLSSGFFVLGHFLPGGKVKINESEVITDMKGDFKAFFKANGKAISVVGLNSDGSQTETLNLEVEDKWAPTITVQAVEILHNVAPSLNVNPLKYEQTTAVIDGDIKVTVMANITGEVKDVMGVIKEVMIADKPVMLDENGQFTTTMLIADKMTSATLSAVDASGNRSEQKIIFDSPAKRPQIFVNDKIVSANSKGVFNHKVKLTRDIKEILVELKDAQGVQITSKRLTIADVFPPILKINDVSYKSGKVHVEGMTVPNATVSAKDETLGFESVEADESGKFLISAKIPSKEMIVNFSAQNNEGKVSKDVPVALKAVKDTKAPSLYVAMPQFNGDQVTISGFAEDKNGIKKITVAGNAVSLSENNHFVHTFSKGQASVVDIEAQDEFDNIRIYRQVLDDKIAPQLSISRWDVENGYLVIEGTATDNTGVKEIKIGKMPIANGDSPTLAFKYKGIITKDSAQTIITAVDLADNEVSEGPRSIDIPQDKASPKGKNLELNYGSPIVYISGEIADNDGIAAVYVNGQAAEIFDDGTFNVKVEINVADPVITLEEPSYNSGQVTVNGKVAIGGFTPSKITVEAEDLSGNRGVLSTQNVAPYVLEEIDVFVSGEPVEMDADGRFNHTQNINFGEKAIVVHAVDPFDNQGDQQLQLESTAPLLELEPLVYDEQNKKAIIKGKAQDEQSGLYRLLINGIKVEFNDDGEFEYETGFANSSISVVARDFIGNERTLSKEVKPPDVWPPVFQVAVKPVPAVIGMPVYIEIKALDSQTGLPENLKEAPVVTLNLDQGSAPLTVEGEGSVFLATLTTDGLGSATIPFTVKGEDKAGNQSDETVGDTTIVLVSEDTITPSFVIESSFDPVPLNKETEIKVFASEQITDVPALNVLLPSGNTKTVALAAVSTDEFSGTLTVPLEAGVGSMTLELTGGTDSSGNVHGSTQKVINLVAPKKRSDIPLNIGFIELLPEKFVIRGKTASEAVVKLEVGPFNTDIVAGPEGNFVFEKNIVPDDLERLRAAGNTVQARIKAHNYAGFNSPERVFDIVLPEPIDRGGEYFDIIINPFPVKQGDLVNFNITKLKRITQKATGYIYLPDGRKITVNLNGESKLTGQYQINQTAPLGPAYFEVVAGDIREGREFAIGLSTGWQQVLNKYEFFNVRVSPDPLIIGKTANFVVETAADIPNVPTLNLILPNGQRRTISLSGSGRSFRGQFLVASDIPSGFAQLVLNQGKDTEIQRPIGIEQEFAMADEVDALLIVNPTPLIAGETFNTELGFASLINFIPQLELKLANGQSIPIPLNGGVPGNRFNGQGALAANVLDGLARFILKDNQGRIMDDFPVNIMPALISNSGVNGFLMPNMMRPMDMVNIQLNSNQRITQRLNAHVNFIDGTKIIVPLYSPDGLVFNGQFQVPDYATYGAVNINVIDQNGKSIFTLRGDVVDDDHSGSFIDIFLDQQELLPGSQARLHVEAGWPMRFIPRAVLRWDGGSLNIPLTGSIPGNRFSGTFTVPTNGAVNGIIEIYDDNNFIIGDMPIDHHGEDEGEVIITPMPPILGQPLSVKIFAPTMVNTAPRIRLNFEDGSSREINAYGPLPGDEFNGSLDQLMIPLVSIDIIHEGEVVASIPITGMPGASQLNFEIDLQGELIQGEDVDILVRASEPVPFVPRLTVDFGGILVDVPINGASFTREFFGRMYVPATADLQQITATLFDPQGRLLWQQNYSGQDGPTGQFYLNAFPVGDTQFDVEWEFIPGADRFELRYGRTPDVSNSVSVQGQTSYLLSGLMPGQNYYIEVIAFSGNVELIRSDVLQFTAGQQTRGLDLQYFVEGNTVNLMWPDYPGANEYRVEWGEAPGAGQFAERVSNPGFSIFDLPFGTIQYIRVIALDQGRVIGESREIIADIVSFQSQGGEINWQPEPPVVGENLDVFVRFANDLPFTPVIFARLQDGDVNLNVNGQLRDFSARLSGNDFTSPLMAIDVLDPNGFMLASRAGSGSGFFSGVPITTAPAEPIIGQQVYVSVEFPEPINFSPVLFVEFASGLAEYTATQGPGNRFYDFVIPAADHSSSLISMDIEDLNGNIIAERFFDSTASQGFHDFGSPLNVSPLPLTVGSPVTLTLDTGDQIFVLPRLRINYERGNQQEVDMQGTVPGNLFNYQIGSLTDYIESIEVIDPSTNTVHFTWYPDANTSSVSNAYINVVPDPPFVNTTFTVTVNFDSPVPFTPWLIMELDNGNIIRYQFSGGPNLMSYTYSVPAGDVTDNLYALSIEDNNGTMVAERLFDSNSGIAPGMNVDITPDPPMPNQPLTVNLSFDAPSPFIPIIWIEFENGTTNSNPFPQAAGQWNYSMNIPAGIMVDYVKRMEIRDDIGTVLAFYEPSGGGALTVDGFNVTPDPPTAGNDLTITVYFNRSISFIPQLEVTFDNGSTLDYAFPSGPGYNTYTITIPSADLTGPIDFISIYDDFGTLIDNGDYYFGPPPAPEYPTGLFIQTTGVAGEIKVLWDRVSGVDGYRVYYGQSTENYTESGSPIEIADPNTTQAIINGLIDGVEYFITVESYVNGGQESNNPTEIRGFPGSGNASFNHVSFSSNTNQSEIGDPIFVTLKAHDESHNVVTGFSGNILIDIQEDTEGSIPESWILSTEDRTAVKGSTSTVELYQGVGYFTVDALEPEGFTIGTPSQNNDGDLSVDFTGLDSTVGTLHSFVIDGKNRAFTGTNSKDGLDVWISAVDSYGNVITDYTGNVTISLTSALDISKVQALGGLSGGGSSYTYSFVDQDDGQAILKLQSNSNKSVTATVSGGGGGSDSMTIFFEGAQQYLFSESGEGNQATIETVSGVSTQSVDVVVKAALQNGEFAEGYSGTAGASITVDPGASTASVSPLAPVFVNGETTVTVSNTEYETVTLQIAGPGPVVDTVDVKFLSLDNNAPEVIDVVVETPWLIRVYFSEEIEETTLLFDTAKYGVSDSGGSVGVDKICWYGDNITINLAEALALGASDGVLSIDATAIKDVNNNTMAANYTNNVLSVPSVDTQGRRLGGSDWYEVQPSNASPSIGEEVTVTVFHKNACGYLTGGNAVNATTGAAGSASVSVSYGSGTVSGDSSVSLSGGKGTFKFTPTAAGSFTITVDQGTVSGSVDITVN